MSNCSRRHGRVVLSRINKSVLAFFTCQKNLAGYRSIIQISLLKLGRAGIPVGVPVSSFVLDKLVYSLPLFDATRGDCHVGVSTVRIINFDSGNRESIVISQQSLFYRDILFLVGYD